MQTATCCVVERDALGRELTTHGSPAFPLAIYREHLERIPVDWHWHEDLELIYKEAGEGLYAVNDQKLRLHRGEGLFINAGTLHGAWSVNSDPCDICSVVFHPRLIGGGEESVFNRKYLEPFLADTTFSFCAFTGPESELAEEILRVWQLCREESDGFEFEVRNRLSQLFLRLYHRRAGQETVLSPKAQRNRERMKQMLNFIHQNYADPIRTCEIAESASISESECLRCFRAVINCSPTEYMNRYRISRACELLRTTSAGISEIASECGFSDESYFIKRFRETLSLTPGAYRKNLQTEP